MIFRPLKHPDLIVVDESHKFRNTSSDQYALLELICKTPRKRLGELLERVGEMEHEKDMGQTLFSQFEEKEEKLQNRIEELEEDVLVLQIEKKEIEQQVTSNEIALEEAVILPYSEATEFLIEQFPSLSKEELIYHCIEVAAINETKVWTAYSVSDYLRRHLLFNNLEN